MSDIIRLVITSARLTVLLAAGKGCFESALSAVGHLASGDFIRGGADVAMAIVTGFVALWALFGVRFLRLFAVVDLLPNER